MDHRDESLPPFETAGSDDSADNSDLGGLPDIQLTTDDGDLHGLPEIQLSTVVPESNDENGPTEEILREMNDPISQDHTERVPLDDVIIPITTIGRTEDRETWAQGSVPTPANKSVPAFTREAVGGGQYFDDVNDHPAEMGSPGMPIAGHQSRNVVLRANRVRGRYFEWLG